MNAWNIAKWKYKRSESFDLPSTLKASMKLFDCFKVSHLTFCETGFSIDFEKNEVKLTSLEKYKRISLKIFEENMEYLKKEIENGAKITMITVIPPSYKRGKHRRREIVKNNCWKFHVNLKKDIELLTKEEFKKFQRIAVIGVDLNSRYGIAYAVWIWNRNNGSIKDKEMGFIKPKIKPHFFQEKVLRRLQRNHGDAVKNNELFQRINKRIQRQNREWTEKASKEIINIALQTIKKYNSDVVVIAFEDLTGYKASSNNRKEVNKANNQWLRRIAKRTFEKSLWNYSIKILAYKPIKNQKKLEQILVDAYETSKKCSKCGNYIEFVSNNEIYCKYCNRHKNKHLNSADNVVRKAIIDLCYSIDVL